MVGTGRNFNFCGLATFVSLSRVVFALNLKLRESIDEDCDHKLESEKNSTLPCVDIFPKFRAFSNTERTLEIPVDFYM